MNMNWMPHGSCFLWQQWILIPDVVTNALIAISYVSLFFSLSQIYVFVKVAGKYKLTVDDQLIPLTVASFGAFIGWCGLTHVMDIVVIWLPQYEWQVIIQGITGVLSSTTAFFVGKIALATRLAMLRESHADQ